MDMPALHSKLDAIGVDATFLLPQRAALYSRTLDSALTTVHGQVAAESGRALAPSSVVPPQLQLQDVGSRQLSVTAQMHSDVMEVLAGVVAEKVCGSMALVVPPRLPAITVIHGSDDSEGRHPKARHSHSSPRPDPSYDSCCMSAGEGAW